jgi:hypothetical protein
VNDTIAYTLLIAATLAVVVVNLALNTRLNRTSDGKTVTMVAIWAGLALAIATLVKLTLEVW